MKRFASATLTVACMFGLICSSVIGQEKSHVNSIPVAELKAAAAGEVTYVTETLSKAEDYTKIQKKVKRAGGLLACLGQAIVEHPKAADAGVAAADLRDAGLALKGAKDAEAAKAGLAAAEKAMAGEASGNAKDEHEWKGLIGMHDMMEVINSRNSKLRRAVKRLRKPEEEKLHAIALAVLSVAMEADTHEVKNEAEVPEWVAMSVESQKISAELVKAIREKEKRDAAKLFKSLAQSCKSCHEKFRHDDDE